MIKEQRIKSEIKRDLKQETRDQASQSAFIPQLVDKGHQWLRSFVTPMANPRTSRSLRHRKLYMTYLDVSVQMRFSMDKDALDYGPLKLARKSSTRDAFPGTRKPRTV